MSRKHAKQRLGIILPVVAVAIVALIGLVALAVDIGRLVVAQTECQAAADSAAIAGAQSLDGTQNLPGATDTPSGGRGELQDSWRYDSEIRK